MPIFCIKRYE